METKQELSFLQDLLCRDNFSELSKQCEFMFQNTATERRLCLVYYYFAFAKIAIQEYNEAIESLQKCASRLNEKNIDEQLVLALVELEIATCCNKINKEEQAIEYAQSALLRFKKLGDTNGISRSYLVMGTAYIFKNDIHQSIQCYQTGLDHAANHRDTHIRLLLNISSSFTLTREDARVIECLKQALDIIEECELINSTNDRIVTEGLQQRTPLGYRRRAYKLTDLKSQCLCSMAYILNSIGLFDTSTEYMNKGINLAQQTGDNTLIAHLRNNLGSYLLEFSLVSEARKQLEQVMPILPKQGTESIKLGVELNLGECDYQNENYKHAIHHFETALDIATNISDAHGKATCFERCAKTHRKLGSLEKAQQYLNQAKQSAATMQDDYLHIVLQMEEAMQLVLANNKQAIHLLQDAVEKCRIHKYKAEEITALQYLAESCSALQQHKQAKEYYQELLRVQQETFTARAHQQITTLSVLHQTETLQLEKQVLQERERNLEQERDHLQNQLTMKTNAMMEQIKAINQLRSEVLDTLKDIDSAEAILGKIKKKLNASSVLRQDWNTFIDVFNQVHPSFVKNLTKQFPNLTKMEIRVCILLRTGMSTDDMAQLLFLSDRSIESHRSNLRKKLNLKRGESLITILSTL